MREVGIHLPEGLAIRARELQWLPPDERRNLLRGDAALLVDRLLARVARGRGALDVALGEGLNALSVGKRVLRLGFSGIGDYARERLGLAPATARGFARLARELPCRPLLADALRKGAVSSRKAQVILPVALGEAEAHWVSRARTATVRALEVEVQAARGGAAPEPEEEWEQLAVGFPAEHRAVLNHALAVARKVVGAAAPRWQLLEAICQEFLGACPVEPGDDEKPAVLHGPLSGGWKPAVMEWLEQKMEQWAILDRVEDVAAPDVELSSDPFRLDEQLRELAAARDEWDATLGHLAFLVKSLGLWRDMQFLSFGHYCAERLGLAQRTIEQRLALERKLFALPALKQALRDGAISYEKARIVARHANERTEQEWLARAQELTCVELSRAAAAEEEAQMCSAGAVRVVTPRSVTALLTSACLAVRQVTGRPLPPHECLSLMARHFVAVWEPACRRKNTARNRALARDLGLCQVPGCSHAAAQVHHITYRSRGGTHVLHNLVSLCEPHHQHGVHDGFIRVHGDAEDVLTWELGCRPWSEPLLVFRRQAKARLETAGPGALTAA